MLKNAICRRIDAKKNLQFKFTFPCIVQKYTCIINSAYEVTKLRSSHTLARVRDNRY